MIPFFVTGARAKIKIDGTVVAYCGNLSLTVQINSVAPKFLGMIESQTVEPLSYDINGSFSLAARYLKDPKKLIKEIAKDIPDAGSEGNGMGSILTIKPQLNPSEILSSNLFELEVYHKVISEGKLEEMKNFTIKKCRITGTGINMSRTLMGETYSFIGCYLDPDSYDASSSVVQGVHDTMELP